MTTQTIATKYNHINVIDFTNEEHKGLILVKIRPSLWLVTETNGYYITHAKTKKSALEALTQYVAERVKEQAVKVIKTTKKATKAVKAVVKREKRRLLTGNIMKFPFGQKISSSMTNQYIKKAWKGVFKVVDADIVNGYWGGTVEHVKTGEVFKVVRLDYIINYIRAPKGTETFEDVRKLMVERGVASA